MYVGIVYVCQRCGDKTYRCNTHPDHWHTVRRWTCAGCLNVLHGTRCGPDVAAPRRVYPPGHLVARAQRRA